MDASTMIVRIATLAELLLWGVTAVLVYAGGPYASRRYAQTAMVSMVLGALPMGVASVVSAYQAVR